MRLRSFVPIAGLSAFLAVGIAAPAATPEGLFLRRGQDDDPAVAARSQAIRSFHFPAAGTPNIQVYRYDPTSPAATCSCTRTRAANVHPVKLYCGTGASRPASAIAEPQTLKGKRAVTCTVSASQTFEVTHSKRGARRAWPAGRHPRSGSQT